MIDALISVTADETSEVTVASGALERSTTCRNGDRSFPSACEAGKNPIGPNDSRRSMYFVSFATPTIWNSGRGTPGGSSIWNAWPIGSCPSKYFFTNDSVTITTFSDVAVSRRSSNSRPLRIGVPIVLKYPALTLLKFTTASFGFLPLITMLLFQPLPLTGTMNAFAADWTPGNAASRAVMLSNTGGSCSGG